MKLHNTKIAVVGAGLAGLTAAYRLTQCGLEVDVFEAKNRVGGRVFTVLMENYLGKLTEVELGAQNITDGGKADNFISLANNLKLSIKEHTIDINQMVYAKNEHAYYSDLIANHNKNPKEIYKLADKSENIAQLIELFCEGNTLLEQALFTRMMAYEGLDPNKQSIYHNIETLECTLSGGLAKAHESYERQHNQIVISSIEGGNSKITTEIERSLKNKIHYNKVLKKFNVHDNSAFLIFEDKTVYEFDYVVLAIPAATFNNIDFSESMIEMDRLKSIKSISYGSNYKIALPLNLGGKINVRSIIKDNVISFYNHDDTIQLLYINDRLPNISDFIDNLSASCGQSVGPFSGSLLQARDQNYEIYGHSNIYYEWGKDQFIQGAYAGYSVSISKELDQIVYHLGTPYKALFTPIKNILFFAGEHTTILECPGTMEAAVESGVRIANAINWSRDGA